MGNSLNVLVGRSNSKHLILCREEEERRQIMLPTNPKEQILGFLDFGYYNLSSQNMPKI